MFNGDLVILPRIAGFYLENRGIEWNIAIKLGGVKAKSSVFLFFLFSLAKSGGQYKIMLAKAAQISLRDGYAIQFYDDGSLNSILRCNKWGKKTTTKPSMMQWREVMRRKEDDVRIVMKWLEFDRLTTKRSVLSRHERSRNQQITIVILPIYRRGKGLDTHHHSYPALPFFFSWVVGDDHLKELKRS